jgi:hypothetical protein
MAMVAITGTDDAAARAGRLVDFVSWVKKENNSINSNHFIIDRHAVASKTPYAILNETLIKAVPVINFIKNRELNTRMSRQLCAEMDAEYTAILFYSEIGCLPRGIMLKKTL